MNDEPGSCLFALGVLLIVTLAGCAPPPDNDARVLDAGLEDAQVPAWLWSGADHPEWATCRPEPPSALCTEIKP